MFQKKEYIFSEAMGVCRVDDITKLVLKKGEAVLYYVLRSVYQKDKVAYIPVENHSVALRKLITYEQAKEMEDLENGAEEAKEPDIDTQTAVDKEKKEMPDWQMQLLMADTLPKEKRDRLYKKGEIEFVLKSSK